MTLIAIISWLFPLSFLCSLSGPRSSRIAGAWRVNVKIATYLTLTHSTLANIEITMNFNAPWHVQRHTCTIVGGRSCVACQESFFLESHISNIERELATWKARRYPVRRTFNAYHDSITTRLPAEVVSNIFIQLIESPPDGFVDTDASEVNRTFEISNKTQYQWIPAVEKRRVYTPLQLGAICSAWRQIAWSTPQLWTKIGVNIGHDYLAMGHAELLNDCLDRSKTLPLRLKLTADDQTDVDMRTMAMIFVLLTHSRRWAYLDVSLPLDIGRLLCCNSSAQPELKELRFFHVKKPQDEDEDDDEDEDAPDKEISINPSWQHLTHLTLDVMSPKYVVVDWAIVTHMRLDDLDNVDLFAILYCAPRLTHLIISSINYNDEDSQFPNPIEHFDLRYFELRDIISVQTVWFIEKISFPALEEFKMLNIEIPLNLVMVPPFLCSLVCIRRMSIQYLISEGDCDVVSALENVPSLEYLELFIMDDGDDLDYSEDDSDSDAGLQDLPQRRNIDPLLRRLSESDGWGRTKFLPNMKELYVHGYPELSWNLIPAIVSSSSAYHSQVHNPSNVTLIEDKDYSRLESLQITEKYGRPLSSLRFDFELYASPQRISRRDCLLLLPLLDQGVSLIIGDGTCPGTILQAALNRHHLP